MNILDKIVATKHEELKSVASFTELLAAAGDAPKRASFFDAITLKGSSKALSNLSKPYSIISEVKKASPSKGLIRADFDPVKIAQAYEAGGANALSVLTDIDYFQGSLEYLKAVSEVTELPLIRKDFVIDARQILEAKINGASAVLLIAAILDDSLMKDLYDFAYEQGLDVLLEVHDANELERALAIKPQILGVNNRNLKTFDTSLEVFVELAEKYKPELSDTTFVAESGIYTKEDIDYLASHGADSFLIGESLMRQDDVTEALRALK